MTIDSCVLTWWEHLIMTVIPFLLGLLLGYLLWYRYRHRVRTLRSEVDDLEQQIELLRTADTGQNEMTEALQERINRLEADLSASRMAFSSLQSKYQLLETSSGEKHDKPQEKASTTLTPTPVTDDLSFDRLTRIDGIGPKSQQILYNNGITTYSGLAKTTPGQIRELLDQAGSRFRALDPETWPKQARLAAQENWEGLKAYQQRLFGGREPESIRAGTPPPDITAIPEVFGQKYKLDDLKLIEGIGPKIERILKKEGIDSWSLLGAVNVSRLREILGDAGSRFSLADPGTWPRQSRMAARGEWKKLKAYQDTLDGGRE